MAQSSLAADDMAAIYDKLVLEVEQFVQATGGQTSYTTINTNMLMLRDCLVHVARNRDIVASHAVIQKVNVTFNLISSFIAIFISQCVETLQDGLMTVPSESEPVIMRFKEIIIRILKSIQDPRIYSQQWVNKQVTRFLTDCRDDLRYCVDAVETLIRAGLVNLPQYDVTLTQLMDNGLNYMAVNFAMQLVQLFLIEERGNQAVTETDFCNTVEMLTKIQTHTRQPPEGLSNVMDMLRQSHDQTAYFGDRAPAGPTVHIHNGILQVRLHFYCYVMSDYRGHKKWK